MMDYSCYWWYSGGRPSTTLEVGFWRMHFPNITLKESQGSLQRISGQLIKRGLNGAVPPQQCNKGPQQPRPTLRSLKQNRKFFFV